MALSVGTACAQESIADALTFGEYEPNFAYPFGRINPDAPVELQQFEFMVGDNECIDHIRQDDGSWQKAQAKWNARYFMNGYGIQDKYWTDSDFVTSNIRIFDKKKNKWIVTFFSMPQYSSGVWEGSKEGENLVMRQERKKSDGSVSESRLTFYNISDSGFDWVAATVDGDQVIEDWKSSCKNN